MGFFSTVFLIFCIICTLWVKFTEGGCQCNQMLHQGVFSGERMTFAVEGNHDRETRSDNGGKQSSHMGAISFEPPYLDFGEQPVGMPYVHDVVVVNPSSDKNLQLHPFPGDDKHFHVSFSKSQALLPLSNTTFEVIFIARTFGNVEKTLFIQTSNGPYPYQVRGYGVANPYRLRPYLGARVALDHIFTSLLYMYNPHDTSLQVTEIYSSGGDLHLELPSGQDDASPEYWQIAPYETKAIIRMNFHGRVVSNHTGFIRIRTNHFIAPKQFLILPVEIEVTTAPGLFPSVDMLDFGTLRKTDEPKSIVVWLLNTHNQTVNLKEVIVDPPNRAIKVHVRNKHVKAAQKYIASFSVTFTASDLVNLKQNHGKIILKSDSKGNPRMELNFQANVLEGTLKYSVSKTRFFIGPSPYEPVVRKMVITNTFTFPLVIYRVVVSPDVRDSISVVNFSSPTVVGEQKTMTPFSVRFLANKTMSSLTSTIRVYTNASIFTIPVQCFDGKLQYRFSESMLNMGTLAVKQRNRKTFQFDNRNPIEIKVKLHTSSPTLAKLEYLNDKNQYANIPADGILLKPSAIVVFCLDVKVPSADGDYSGNIIFTTSYETKVMQFSFKAASGHIEVDPVKIVFNNTFPGQTQKAPLFLTSTFLDPINVFSTLLKAEEPFIFVPVNRSDAQLAPNRRQKIGDVVLNPKLACSADCYVGIGKSKEKAWFSSLSLPPDTPRIDTLILENFQTKWNSFVETKKNSFKRSLYIDTETVRGIEVTVQGGLKWPSLTSDRPIRFPLTHVGNISHKTLTLENPADIPVVVQVVPLSLYPDAQPAIDVLSDRFDVDLLTAKPSYHSCFSLPSAKVDKYLLDKPDSDVTSSLDATLGVRTSPDVISMIIAPRSKANVPLQFKPENEDQRTSVIFIRNNLTVLDVVSVQGQGARGELMINGKRPSGDSVLLFELKQKHLEDCTKLTPSSGGKPYRSLTVKKTVLATNPGQLATHVTSFNIDGYECEGYGFKVLNCKALNLKPSASVKIDIAFTPDFSVSRVSRRLQIKTSLGSVFEFSLIATIPSELIPLCAAGTGRPRWEYEAYISSAAIMICLLVVTLVLAHFEARKLIIASRASLPHNQILLNGTHLNGDIFDLRKISASTQAPLVPDSAYPPQEDSNGSARTNAKETITAEKTKAVSYPQPFRRSSSDNSCERVASNNNSITKQTSEYDKLKVKLNDKDVTRKQKRTANQAIKRKDSDTDNSKSLVQAFPSVTAVDTSTMDLNSECAVNETVKSSRDSSSSEGNSVFSDTTIRALPAKKDKSKMRKKTAKVSPACMPVEEKKTKVVDKVTVKDNESMKDKEKTDSLEKGKDRKTKQNSESKEDIKEPKKQDVNKSVKVHNNKANSKASRKISLPNELEETHSKPKLDKSKSLPISSSSKLQSSKSGHNVANKKNSSNSSKHTQQNEDTPRTITETINSALEITLKNSPTAEAGQNFQRSHSRCSSTSPSPPLSDSSQSSRSSSYSSVVGSEESANSEPSGKRKKPSKSQKPSPLVIQKPTEHSNPFTVKRLAGTNIVNDLSGPAWKGLWDTTRDLRGSPSLESFPSSSMSSSLFTSTPFDKDGKLERHKLGEGSSADEDQSRGKYPLYTFQDVKAPGLSTPFVEVGTAVPKFWPDEPIPSLENLIPMKQARNTNWVNFLDESSANASKLPSPGMPQSSKTVAEIWDAGHWADENDGWSTAFSPTLESDETFPSFPGAYDSAWSTGTYQHDYYGMPSEETWVEADASSTEADMMYGSNDNAVYSSGTFHQLNPYSEPWDGSSQAKQNAWSSSNY